jgi:hypothetical protein
MNAFLLIGGIAALALMVVAFVSARRRIRSGPHNNWANEAFLAREETHSWSENECAVGRENAAPPSIFPGVK